MSENTKYYFTYNSAQEESSYFTGEIDATAVQEPILLSPGEYRVIDGKLSKIRTGLDKIEVKEILNSRTK